jgi:hypothetical protein
MQVSKLLASLFIFTVHARDCRHTFRALNFHSSAVSTAIATSMSGPSPLSFYDRMTSHCMLKQMHYSPWINSQSKLMTYVCDPEVQLCFSSRALWPSCLDHTLLVVNNCKCLRSGNLSQRNVYVGAVWRWTCVFNVGQVIPWQMPSVPSYRNWVCPRFGLNAVEKIETISFLQRLKPELLGSPVPRRRGLPVRSYFMWRLRFQEPHIIQDTFWNTNALFLSDFGRSSRYF